jgi:ribosomal protein L32
MTPSSPSLEPRRYGSRDGSALTNTNTPGCCPACGRTPPSARALYCDDACKQRAFRLRHQTRSNVDLGQLRRDLQHRRTLVAHTVYECSTCGERALGERRCAECGLFMQALGLGGTCQGCDETILLSELLGLE